MTVKELIEELQSCLDAKNLNDLPLVIMTGPLDESYLLSIYTDDDQLYMDIGDE